MLSLLRVPRWFPSVRPFERERHRDFLGCVVVAVVGVVAVFVVVPAVVAVAVVVDVIDDVVAIVVM